MKGISINGKKLHELGMPLVQHPNSHCVITMQYPKNRIHFEMPEKDILKLTIPSKLALEMYRVGILPQDKNQYVPVRVSGKSIGKYKVIDFLYPDTSTTANIVFIKLQKQKESDK